MSCLSQAPSSSSSPSLRSLPALVGASVCGSPAGQRLRLAPLQRELGRVLGMLPPAVPVPVGGVQLSRNAAVLDLSSGSSLPSPPHLLLLTLSPALLHRRLPLLPVTGGGGWSPRSPGSLEERGGVEPGLGAARVPALGHGEIHQRPLLVAARSAGSLLLGRDAGHGGGLPRTEAAVVVGAAAAWRDGHRGDGGLGGGGCHGADQGGRQGLQFDLAPVFQLQKQQESC